MSGFGIQLMQLSQLSKNRVIALETHIPQKKKIIGFFLYRRVDFFFFFFSKTDKYLKVANILLVHLSRRLTR